MGKQNKNQSSMTPSHSRVAFLYAASELLAKLATKPTTTEATLSYKQRKTLARHKKYENATFMKRIRSKTGDLNTESDSKSESLNKLSRYLGDTMTQVLCCAFSVNVIYL